MSQCVAGIIEILLRNSSFRMTCKLDAVFLLLPGYLWNKEAHPAARAVHTPAKNKESFAGLTWQGTGSHLSYCTSLPAGTGQSDSDEQPAYFPRSVLANGDMVFFPSSFLGSQPKEEYSLMETIEPVPVELLGSDLGCQDASAFLCPIDHVP